MAAVKRILGAISSLAGRFLGRDTEEMRHEREMADLEAFNRGRITPGYLAKYVAIGVFGLGAIAILVEACWPNALPGSPVEALEHIVTMGMSFLRHVFGM